MKLVLMAMAVARLVAAGDSTLEFFPGDTKVVFGIHVRAIADSTLFKDAGADAQKLSAEWLKVVAITGFDPLHDIDEVLMASSADKENAPAILVLRGRFDLTKMGIGAPRYHGVAMLGDGKVGNSVLALLDAATAVAGDAPAVRAAIDRHGQGAALESALAARVQSLRERFDLWGIGERPEGFVAPTGKNEQLDSMDRFEFGVRIRNGIELGAEIHARSAKDAEKLAASVTALQAMAMMSGGAQAGPKIDVQVNDGTLRISVAISEEAVKKAMAARQGTRPPMGGPPVVVSSETTVPTPGSSTSGGTTVFTLPGKK
jgi:hypothetical protein